MHLPQLVHPDFPCQFSLDFPCRPYKGDLIAALPALAASASYYCKCQQQYGKHHPLVSPFHAASCGTI